MSKNPKINPENTFNLSKSELKVFNYLRDNNYSINRFKHTGLYKSGEQLSPISISLKMPKMTCFDAIQKLIERGLVLETKKANAKYYSLLDADTVTNNIRKYYNAQTVEENNVEKSYSIPGEITIYRGLENCHSIWRKIADLHKGDKLISIQPNSSIKETMKKLGIKALYPSNDALNSKGIINEAIVHNTCYEEIYNLLRKEAGYDFAINELEKASHRVSNITLVDSKYLQSPTELFFMHNAAYFVNWKDEVAIEIKNKTITNFLHELYELARGYGKKINQQEYTRALITKIKKNHITD